MLIGGLPASISYQGRNGYPGLDQINVTVPQAVAPGCAVSVVAVNSNYQVISNSVTLPVAAGGGACSDLVTGIRPELVATLSGKDTVHVGLVAVEVPAPILDFAGSGASLFSSGAAVADFFSMPGSSFGAFAAGQYLEYPATLGFDLGLSPQVSVGSCVSGTGFEYLFQPSLPMLDAGVMTAAGAGGVTTMPLVPATSADYSNLGEYLAAIGQADGFGLSPVGGTITFGAAGGQDIGAFTATVSLPLQEQFAGIPSLNQPFSRSGQTITWTGGVAGEFVTISGTNQNATQSASFTCNADAAAGQFTIPSYALVPLATIVDGATGSLSIQVSTYPQIVTAPGLDAGYVFGYAVPVQMVTATYK